MRRIGGELKVPTNVYLIHKYKEAYEEKHGQGKISELVNAILKEEYEKEKNEEAQRCDPLSLLKSPDASDHITKKERQLTLFEDYGVISKYIHSLDDVTALAKIEKTGKVVHDLAHTRKMRVLNGLQHVKRF